MSTDNRWFEPQQIAAALGLQGLSSGRHPAGIVDYVWWATVFPSFDLPAVVAVTKFDSADNAAGHLRATFRAASFKGETQGVSGLANDPLPEAVRGMELIAAPEGACLDGISYELAFDGIVSGHLRISRPLSAGLQRVEHSLYAVAEQVAIAADEPLLLQYLETWKGYLA